MKAKFFGVMLLSAAITFIGCEPVTPDPGQPDQPGGGKDTTEQPVDDGIESIVIEPNEVSLNLGGTIRLSYTLYPEGATGEVTWSSEDTTIATVTERGYVEAVGYGTVNIVATCGKHNATCKVTIKTYHQNLQFSNAVVWDVDTLAYGGEVYTISASTGEEFKCYLASAELWIFADGFFINNSGDLDGGTEASYIDLWAPMFYGTKALNGGQGVNFCLGDWTIGYNHGDTIMLKDGEAGEVDKVTYMAAMKAFASAYNEAVLAGDDSKKAAAYANLEDANGALTGAYMQTLVYHTTAEGYSSDGYYLPLINDGVVPTGAFSLNAQGVSKYMCGLEYAELHFLPIADDQDHLWGCSWEFDENGLITWVDEEFHFGEEIVYTTGTMPTESKKFTPIYAPVIKQDCPEVAKRLEKQLKSNNVLRIKH